MEYAKTGLQEGLRKTEIRDADLPVYANVTGEPVRLSSDIRDLLHRQLTSPVLWEQTIRNMVRDGASGFYELGPGKVLQGLARRTEPTVQVAGIDKVREAEELASK
jgi:[acyl-carrier-protein] S-malonyltransferase